MDVSIGECGLRGNERAPVSYVYVTDAVRPHAIAGRKQLGTRQVHAVRQQHAVACANPLCQVFDGKAAVLESPALSGPAPICDACIRACGGGVHRLERKRLAIEIEMEVPCRTKLIRSRGHSRRMRISNRSLGLRVKLYRPVGQIGGIGLYATLRQPVIRIGNRSNVQHIYGARGREQPHAKRIAIGTLPLHCQSPMVADTSSSGAHTLYVFFFQSQPEIAHTQIIKLSHVLPCRMAIEKAGIDIWYNARHENRVHQ